MLPNAKTAAPALFLADATRLLSSLDVEPALDGVAHLAVPYLGDVCAIDLLGAGQPRRLLVVSRRYGIVAGRCTCGHGHLYERHAILHGCASCGEGRGCRRDDFCCSTIAPT